MRPSIYYAPVTLFFLSLSPLFLLFWAAMSNQLGLGWPAIVDHPLYYMAIFEGMKLAAMFALLSFIVIASGDPE